ncbi:hypothetical protein [Ancylobacter terrae]|uniref:hypothetical protein n=1 Tax=Ancylobacter sp. sgz301288 TaxID=3342077 RepID=UPI00385E25D7
MKRFFNRLWANPVTQWIIIGSFAYSAWHCWQAGGEGWGWPVFWGVIGIHAANVTSAERRRRELDVVEPGRNGPSLLARTLGHPVIAWPIILACGGTVALGVHAQIQKGVAIDGGFLAVALVVLLPALLALRWTVQRSRWKQSAPATAAPVAPASDASRCVPTALVIVPDIPAPPSIAEAMQRLHPSLLALVREGARIEAAQA